MKRISRRRPSPALIVAVMALVAALAGTAIAGAGRLEQRGVEEEREEDFQEAGQEADQQADPLADGDIADGAITGAKIAANAVDGSKVADNSLNDTKMSDYELIGNSFVLLTATEGANEAAARAAAPEVELFTKGQGRIYAKCFRSTATDTTFAEKFAQTSADGAIMEGEDDFPGGNAATDFLNTNTLEADRLLAQEEATGNDADYDESEWTLAFPDGTALNGQDGTAAKNGNLAGGNGIYGAGNVCLFQGSILG